MFQLQSLTALENVSLEFMDTPFENQITDFKQSIIRNYKCFDEWFTKHSISDWYVFLKKRKNFHRSTEMIFFFIKFNKYMNSEEFENGTMNLLNSYNQDVKGPALRLLTSVLIYLERSFLQTLCSHLQ